MEKPKKSKNYRSKLMKTILFLLICIIPALIAYEAYQLVAKSSSYEVNNIKVAVVNEDRPTQQNNRTWDVGGQLVNKLRDDKKSKVHWHFVSENESKRELNDGDVDMAVYLPSDLSINAASALGPRPRLSNIKIRMAKRNNFMSVQVNQQIANDVKQIVTANIQAVYDKILLNDIKEMGNQMKIASKGSNQINGNVLTVRSGKVSVSRDLDALTQQMLNFQDGSKAIDGQINSNSQMLSNQLNANAQNFSNQIQGTSQSFNSKVGANQQAMSSQLNDLSGNFDNQLNTLATGIDTLTINNKKINTSLASLQTGSSSVGGGLQSLSTNSADASKAVNDYTNKFGDLNQQLGSLNQQTAELNNNSQSDQATVAKTQAFVKSAGNLIDQALILKNIDITNLAKLKDDQKNNEALKNNAQEIIDKAKAVGDTNQQINNNDKSALANLTDLDKDDSIAPDVKSNLNDKYISPATKSLTSNAELSSSEAADLDKITTDATTIQSSIGNLSDEVATINKLVPAIQDLDKNELLSPENKDDAKTLTEALPHVVKTLQSIKGLSDATDQSTKTSNSLANNSEGINNNVAGLQTLVNKVNSDYSGVDKGLNGSKTDSDGVINEGQAVAENGGQIKANKAQAIRGVNNSADQGNAALANDLQAGLGQLSSNLDSYKGFDLSNMNQNMIDKVAANEKNNNDQLANAADSVKGVSQKASDNDNKIHDALGNLINNNRQLHGLLNRNAEKVIPINAKQKNVNSMINPVNNTVSGKGYGATLNKLFAPTIIAVVLYVGALLTYMAKIYSRRHRSISFGYKAVTAIAIIQAITVDFISVYFQVEPSNIVLLLLISTVAALSFNYISLAMNKIMGLVGLILMVVLLAVQIVISNNVIPANALGIFNKLAFLLPLTYGVKALNDVINSLLYTPALTGDMLALVAYPAILFAISFGLQKYRERKMLEKD
ncbi:YhgE/Pip family protein [Fructilactobacillus carniphilus]|uniref:YhgE/Pip family protein n=1 Tax=Fructilactobacillus carniphilus TaxID=2940297 RepID=A0ABY5BVD2_9LACO|nr:YhgE/Pip family protein [Fructilactobacillus carniphilus]USS90297.1 YhgE/Pip family protein [Fructilactobacillus carniphilus]